MAEEKVFLSWLLFCLPEAEPELKGRDDYIFMAKNKRDKKMVGVLDRLFEDQEIVFLKELPDYIVKISQVKKSFYVLVRKPSGKVLGRDKKALFEKVEKYQKIVIIITLEIVLG